MTIILNVLIRRDRRQLEKDGNRGTFCEEGAKASWGSNTGVIPSGSHQGETRIPTQIQRGTTISAEQTTTRGPGVCAARSPRRREDSISTSLGWNASSYCKHHNAQVYRPGETIFRRRFRRLVAVNQGNPSDLLPCIIIIIYIKI